MVMIAFRTGKRVVTARACLLEGQRLWKTPSRQAGLLLMQAAIGWQEFNMEGNIFIDRGGAVMTLQGLHLPPDGSPSKIAHHYHLFLTKNLLAFEKILQQS
jgi:hypothetical protein